MNHALDNLLKGIHTDKFTTRNGIINLVQRNDWYRNVTFLLYFKKGNEKKIL